MSALARAVAAPRHDRNGYEKSGRGMPERKEIRLSAGTARVLGLSSLKIDENDLPTTAYLLTAKKCVHDCQFCSQGRSAGARADLLSRVTWPELEKAAVADAFSGAPDRLRRVCLQVTDHHGWIKEVEWLTDMVQAKSRDEMPLPTCVSCRPRSLSQVAELIAMGVDKVGIAIDAVTPEIYARVKGGAGGDGGLGGQSRSTSWHATLGLVLAAARAFPGRIATHVIIGLGEREKDAVELMRLLADYGVIIGLFAFTPVRGTPLENETPPDLGQYRRMQLVRHLLAAGETRGGLLAELVDALGFRFDEKGRLVSLGLGREELKRLSQLLLSGDAFRTSGCPDCNRPYYNERPGGVIYNYPRPLTEDEARAALAETGLFGEEALGETAEAVSN